MCFCVLGSMCSLQLPPPDRLSWKQHWNGKIRHCYCKISALIWFLVACALAISKKPNNITALYCTKYGICCFLTTVVCFHLYVLWFLSHQNSHQTDCEYVTSPLNPVLSKGCAKYCNATKQVRQDTLKSATVPSNEKVFFFFFGVKMQKHIWYCLWLFF